MRRLQTRMRTDDFDFDIPTGLIAQSPSEPRDSCRLMVVDRSSGQIDHRLFSELPEYLRDGDVLVVNDTRVLPARLHGVKDETGAAVEILLLRERYEDTWECLVRPGRKLRPGTRVIFDDGAMVALVLDAFDDAGGRLVQFMPKKAPFMDVVHRIGEVPLPPYISRPLEDPEAYQTVFAREERSAAAPTAGLHFTPGLLDRCRESGAAIETIELDVGLDTFRPVTEDDPCAHRIHTEHFTVTSSTAEAVNRARETGGRVIAVGTTSVRALESAFDEAEGLVQPVQGSTSLYILPGFRFGATDAMITNFHVPRTTLVMMVSAFAGRDLISRAYAEAVDLKYRFFSFGDAILVL